MRFRRRCKAHTGTTFVIDGQQDFRCELPADGHEWHERTSEPVRGRWREIEGGLEFAMGEAGNAAVTLGWDSDRRHQ